MRSPPTWGCGLKLKEGIVKVVLKQSPPTWGCGLKPEEAREDEATEGGHPPRGGVD